MTLEPVYFIADLVLQAMHVHRMGSSLTDDIVFMR